MKDWDSISYLVKSVEEKQFPRSSLTCDPYKTTTSFDDNQNYLRTQNEFWKLYINNRVDKCKFPDMSSCDDISVFLTIITKAGCFLEKEAKSAHQGLNLRNLWAHPDIKSFTDHHTNIILTQLDKLLDMLPENSKKEPRRRL